MIKKIVFFSLGVIFLLSACVRIQNEVSGLPPGHWNCVLKIGSNPFPVFDEDAVRERRVAFFKGPNADELFFEMEVEYPTPDSFIIYFINGKEKIQVKKYNFGVDRSTAHDTIRIFFPEYNSYIFGEFIEDVIQAEWVDMNRKNYRIPFVAKHGVPGRFPNIVSDTFMNVDGQWEVTFEKGDNQWKALGEFKQMHDTVWGTFRTETGDYRYLAGKVYEDELYLSTFDGTHAFLFGAEMQENGSLDGFFKSGIHYSAFWTAKKNENYELAHPDTLTKVVDKPDFNSIELIDLDGKSVSLADQLNPDKAYLITLMGTWCPNCKDEIEFLKSIRNKPSDLEILAIAFERGTETEGLERIRKYKTIMDIPFQMFYGGPASKKGVQSKFSFLDDFRSYPTLLFINKKHQIEHIHTGFNGPATSAFPSFKQSFDQKIKSITQ